MCMCVCCVCVCVIVCGYLELVVAERCHVVAAGGRQHVGQPSAAGEGQDPGLSLHRHPEQLDRLGPEEARAGVAQRAAVRVDRHLEPSRDRVRVGVGVCVGVGVGVCHGSRASRLGSTAT